LSVSLPIRPPISISSFRFIGIMQLFFTNTGILSMSHGYFMELPPLMIGATSRFLQNRNSSSSL